MSDESKKDNDEDALEDEAYERNAPPGDRNPPVADDDEPPVQSWSWDKRLAVIAAFVLVIIVLIGFNQGAFSDSDSTTQSGIVTETVTAMPPTVTALPEECSNGYPLNFHPEGAIPELQLLPDKAGSDHAVDTDADIRKGLKESPRFLAAFADWLYEDVKVVSKPLWADPSDWKPLATSDNKCLSDKGVELLDKVIYELDYHVARVDENGEVDPNWTNMGLSADGPVSNAESGIEGDRSAVVYYFKDKDGNFIEAPVMKRCANLPGEKPSHPTVPPSHFTPPPPPTTPPPPVTTTTTTPPETTTTTTTPTTTTTTETTPTTTTTTETTTSTTETTTTETTPPTTTTTTSLAPKPSTTAPWKPPGITPQPLDPRDTLQPTKPTLAPGTTRQTTPIPSNAPIITTPRSTPPPPVPSELPRTTQAPTSVIITRPPVPGSSGNSVKAPSTQSAPVPTRAPAPALAPVPSRAAAPAPAPARVPAPAIAPAPARVPAPAPARVPNKVTVPSIPSSGGSSGSIGSGSIAIPGGITPGS